MRGGGESFQPAFVVRKNVLQGLLRKHGSSDRSGLAWRQGSGQTDRQAVVDRNGRQAVLRPSSPPASQGPAAAVHHPSTPGFRLPAFSGKETVLIPFGFHHGVVPGCLITFAAGCSPPPFVTVTRGTPRPRAGGREEAPLAQPLLCLLRDLSSVAGCGGGVA